MKKLLTIMLSVLMVASLSACSKKDTAETETPVEETAAAETTAPTETEETTELANPWVDCNDEQEAAQIAGFEFEVAESLGTDGVYRAVEGQIIEVTLGNELNVPFTFRKALGFDGETLAGDYNEYENGGTLQAGDVDVTYAGDGEDSINVAYWTIGDYTYSFTSNAGIPAEALTSYVELVK